MILKHLLPMLLLIISFTTHSKEVIWSGVAEILLDEHMEFAVSDNQTLQGNEKWFPKIETPPRNKAQYLHFRVSINNPQRLEKSLWFIIPFPAIKQLTVTDGLDIWNTGDAKPFSTRPVVSPDYIFPVHLKASQTTQISGSMQGEILRYSFSLNTPENASANSRVTIIRDMSFLGAMGTLAVACLVIFAATRFRPYLSFSVFTFFLGAWFFRLFGYGFEFLWPNHPQVNDASYGLLIYALMVSSSWMFLALLKRRENHVAFDKLLLGYTAALVVAGLFSAVFLDLKTSLDIPLYWFFPVAILWSIIILKEHKTGSIKAKWFAISMIPFALASLMVVLFALGFELPFDPLGSLMLGIIATCLLLTALISTYLIKILQHQRDLEIQQSKLKTQQANELETLVKDRTQELELSNQRLKDLAAKDPLTKLPNRRSMDLFIDKNLSNLGIAIMDLDHFKQNQ